MNWTAVRRCWSSLDDLLHGRRGTPDELREGRVGVPALGLLKIALSLGVAYGLCMGLFSALRGGLGGSAQLLSSATKVPLLFLLTLAVTFPSLYVVSALCRLPIRVTEALRLLLAAIAINLAVLASLGPVTAFFSLSTRSYPFMVLLNVTFFTVGGIAGLSFLRRAMRELLPLEPSTPSAEPAAVTSEPEAEVESASEPAEGDPFDPLAFSTSPESSPPRRKPLLERASEQELRVRSRRIVQVWIVIYGVVGAQMGWILRPFVGSPGLPFELFRSRESSFFGGVFRALGQLLS